MAYSLFMPFANGGYYNYDRLLYKADYATGIRDERTIYNYSGAWYDLQGRKLSAPPTKKGLYIHGGKKVIVK